MISIPSKVWTMALIPAVLAGAIAVYGWNHAPWGDHSRLGKTRGWLAACQIDRRKYAGWSAGWQGLYNAQGADLKTARAQAATSLTSASARSDANAKSSFQAGVIAGRALERRQHAQTNDPAHPDVRLELTDPDGVSDDFLTFWRGSPADRPD